MVYQQSSRIISQIRTQCFYNFSLKMGILNVNRIQLTFCLLRIIRKFVFSVFILHFLQNLVTTFYEFLLLFPPSLKQNLTQTHCSFKSVIFMNERLHKV